MQAIYELGDEGLVMGGSTGINVAGAVRTGARPRSRPHHRDHPRRLRLALSEQALQPGVPEGARAADPALAVIDIPRSSDLDRWLGERLGRPWPRASSTRSWFMPGTPRDAGSRVRRAAHPGRGVLRHRRGQRRRRARCRTCCRAPADFATPCGGWGVNGTPIVVVYDSDGLFSRRASGGVSAPWATARSSCSTAACQLAGRGPSGRGRLARARARGLQGALPAELVQDLAGGAHSAGQRRGAGARRPPGGPLPRRGA